MTMHERHKQKEVASPPGGTFLLFCIVLRLTRQQCMGIKCGITV